MIKSTIDHKIRLKLGITCDQYVFLDYLASLNGKKPSIEQAEKAIGFTKQQIWQLSTELQQTGFVNTDLGYSIITDLWLVYFDRLPFVKDVIEYFNLRTNSDLSYKSRVYGTLINARLKERDYTFDDFKLVIDSKTKEWFGTEMEKYLRPSTLFNGNFESYLNFAKKDVAPERKMVM